MQAPTANVYPITLEDPEPAGATSPHVVFAFGGGSIRGAFAAGLLESAQDLINEGLLARPRDIVGISVGALNAALCALNVDNLGRVWRFWDKQVTEPGDLVESKSLVFRVLPGLIRGRFDGLVSVAPLERMIRRWVSMVELRASPITIHTGAVNLADGALGYSTQHAPSFHQRLLASSSIPVVMPLVRIGPEILVDGGLFDVAPISKAVALGADEIVVFLCQPPKVEAAAFDERDPLALVDRIMAIVTDRIVRANVAEVEAVNSRLQAVARASTSRWHREDLLVSQGLLGKRPIRTTILRPDEGFPWTISNFTHAGIGDMIHAGQVVGRRWADARRAEDTPGREDGPA
jgi:NTE family protein